VGVKNSFLQNCEIKEKQKRRLAANIRVAGTNQSVQLYHGRAKQEKNMDGQKKGVGKVKADLSSLAFSIENWQN